jgi:hypothetical protein
MLKYETMSVITEAWGSCEVVLEKLGKMKQLTKGW